MAECSGKNHENHMCQVVARKEMDAARQKAQGAKYFCNNCGRSAKCETDVCNPVAL